MSGTTRGNLPAETTALVGRSAELAEAQRLLTSARLVTVVGPGGVGKSRLGLRAAALAAAGLPDGAWVVEGSPVSDPDLLGHAVTEGLGLPHSTTRPPLHVLVEHLRERELLLVLDGFEHLVDVAAVLVA